LNGIFILPATRMKPFNEPVFIQIGSRVQGLGADISAPCA
jgi:hypothetical protein